MDRVGARSARSARSARRAARAAVAIAAAWIASCSGAAFRLELRAEAGDVSVEVEPARGEVTVHAPPGTWFLLRDEAGCAIGEAIEVPLEGVVTVFAPAAAGAELAAPPEGEPSSFRVAREVWGARWSESLGELLAYRFAVDADALDPAARRAPTLDTAARRAADYAERVRADPADAPPVPELLELASFVAATTSGAETLVFGVAQEPVRWSVELDGRPLPANFQVPYPNGLWVASTTVPHTVLGGTGNPSFAVRASPLGGSAVGMDGCTRLRIERAGPPQGTAEESVSCSVRLLPEGGVRRGRAFPRPSRPPP